MKTNRLFWILLSVTVTLTLNLLITSCTHDAIDFSLLDTVCFERDILGPLQSSCGKSGCHSISNGSEGFSAAGYSSIHQFVTPGDPRGSKLYEVITDINGENFMPPDQPLSENQRNLIEVWIAQGALNTKCSANIPDTGGNGGTIPIDYGDSVCFNQDILPLFLSNCATSLCHNTTSHVAGYVLTDYTSIISSEEGIVPYNPGSSKLFEVLTTGESDERMPPSPRAQLTSAQIDLMRTWINDGALNSDCPDNTCDTTNAILFSTQVLPIMQNRCVSCHNSSQASAGVMLDNYSHVKATADNIRGNTSVLIGAIRRMTGFKAMPPGYTLDDCSARIIELWIEQGTANN